ncbi:MAG: hypothetical protein ACE5EY_04910 [Anaerolineae bacterium]
MSSPAISQENTAVPPRPITQFFTQSRIRLLATAVALFLLFNSLFAYVQFGTDALAGNDGYYHIKMGYLIRQEGLKPDFPWLPLTILNERDFYDHHLLYHAFLALFAATDPAVDGGAALSRSAKIASVILPSLAFLAIWWLLRGQGVRWAELWAIGLFAVSQAFLYRMSMPRAQSASLLILALGLHWLLKERYWLLIPLGFLYVWTYNAFPLLVVMGGVYLAAALITRQKLVWQAVIFPALGIGLGLLINPYFPENISFIINHLLPKIGQSETRVGNEWYPYRTWTLVENSGFALLAVVAGALALGWQKTRMNTATLTILTLTVLFGYMLFQSRRFIEYFPAFALIFLAVSAAPVLAEWEDWLRDKHLNLRFLIPVGLLILLVYPLQTTLADGRDAVANSKPADRYADAALWLRANSEPGTVVFQTDWDDFTRLFFYNTDAIYTAGLDPTYLELFDQDLYDEWVDITKGRVANPSDPIRRHFGGEFVFSDLNHGNFMKKAEADPGVVEVYRDEYAVIYEVVVGER